MATVTVPPTVPHPTQDCQQLHDAFKGFSLGRTATDERKIIDILAHRSSDHRRAICQMYSTMYKEELKQRVRLELTKNLERAMLWWILDPAERDAQLAREALQNWNPNYTVIIEIACCRTPEQLMNVRRAYQVLYKKSLEEDIGWETIGSIQKLLGALATAYRYSPPEVDMNLAKIEAEKLYECGEGRSAADGIDEDTYVRILSTRSFPQLNAMFSRYKQTYGHDINQGLKNEAAGEFEDAVRITVKCINRPARHFAKMLYFSMKGLGTDDNTLTRVIVTRAEIDMQQIKNEFLRKYQKQLDDMIKRETPEHYRSFLLKLIGSKTET